MTTTDLRGQNVIDCRDIQARITELEGLEQIAKDEVGLIRDKIAHALDDDIPDLEALIWTAEDDTEYGETDDWTEDEYTELRQLQELVSDVYFPGWESRGLIKDSYFVEYAQEQAISIGDISADSWLFNHVNWEQAAEALKQDYKPVMFAGEDYWIRA